jgi:hypothetical protein
MNRRLFNVILIICIVQVAFDLSVFPQSTPCDFSDTQDRLLSDSDLRENSVFIHPNLPNIVAVASKLLVGIDREIAVSVSTDWGINWTESVLDGIRTDPQMAIDLNGNLYAAGLRLHALSEVRIAKSTDLGDSWTYTYLTDYNSDHDYLWIDNYCSSPFKGRMYCAWTESVGYYSIEIRVSSNFGEDWSSVQTLYTCPGQPECSYVGGVTIHTDSDGNVFVAWTVYPSTEDYGPCGAAPNVDWHSIYVTKSTDGGENWWDEPLVISASTTGNMIYSGGCLAVGPTMCSNMETGELFIESSRYVSANSIKTSGEFSSSVSDLDVTFETYSFIQLNDGFTIPEGNTFSAMISSCPPPSAPSYTYTAVRGEDYGQNRQTENWLSNILFQNYPNPFNSVTRINYSLRNNSHVKLKIYDILGRQVKTLINETQIPGNKSVTWDGTTDEGLPVSSGVYLIEMIVDDFHETKKLLIIK